MGKVNSGIFSAARLRARKLVGDVVILWALAVTETLAVNVKAGGENGLKVARFIHRLRNPSQPAPRTRLGSQGLREGRRAQALRDRGSFGLPRREPFRGAREPARA